MGIERLIGSSFFQGCFGGVWEVRLVLEGFLEVVGWYFGEVRRRSLERWGQVWQGGGRSRFRLLALYCVLVLFFSFEGVRRWFLALVWESEIVEGAVIVFRCLQGVWAMGEVVFKFFLFQVLSLGGVLLGGFQLIRFWFFIFRNFGFLKFLELAIFRVDVVRVDSSYIYVRLFRVQLIRGAWRWSSQGIGYRQLGDFEKWVQRGRWGCVFEVFFSFAGGVFFRCMWAVGVVGGDIGMFWFILYFSFSFYRSGLEGFFFVGLFVQVFRIYIGVLFFWQVWESRFGL